MDSDRSKAVRSEVLGRVRAALGERPATPEDIRAEAAALLPAGDVMQPKFEGQTSRARFIEKATSERLTATVDEVPDMAGAVAAVRAYIERSNLPMRIALPPMPALSELDWGNIETHQAIAPNEPIAVGLADYAIAETGTLVFTSRAESPTLFNYLPLHHVILVEASKILRYMEDYWADVRANGNVHPRNTNFITGTSGTADIEAKNVRGAHGPRFMHVVIVGTD